MRKFLLATVAVFAFIAAFAGYDVVSIGSGGSHTVSAPAKVVRVQAVSASATGTLALKRELRWAHVAPSDVVTYTTNFTYTVVGTNYVDGALTYTTNTVAFNPYPFGHDNWTSFTTNRIVTATTNRVPTTLNSLCLTNTLASITCASNVGTNSPNEVWVFPGEVLFVESASSGSVSIILAR